MASHKDLRAACRRPRTMHERRRDMAQGNRSMVKRIPALAAALVVLAVAVSSCAGDSRASRPTAVGGRLDASSWDFEKNGPIPLDGEWEFYWGKLIPPSDFDSGAAGPMSGYIHVPGKWNAFKIGGTEVGNRGFATYRLRVAVSGEEMMALHSFDMGTAFRIFVDGREVFFKRHGRRERGEIGPAVPASARRYSPPATARSSSWCRCRTITTATAASGTR